MATVTIKHASLTGAAANPAVLVDGPKWDAGHTVTGLENVPNVDTTNASNLTSGTLVEARMDLPYVSLEMFGGSPSIADNAPALNAAQAFLSNSALNTIRLRGGVYNFLTKPNDFTTTVIMIGDSPSQTNLLRKYSAGSATEGFITWSGSGANGSRLENLSLTADNGTTNGCLLSITTGTNVVAGFQAINNVVFSHIGTGDYVNCLNVDGTANQTSGSQGIRDLLVTGSFFFHGNSGTESLRLLNATNHNVTGCWANGTCTIYGGGTALTNTTLGKFDMSCISNVFVDRTSFVSFYGNYNSLVFSTNASNCFNAASYPVGNFTDSGTNNSNAGNVVIGASSGANGASGVVPKPFAGQQNYVLQGNGSWVNVLTGMTLTTAIASGVWTASGTWTLPALTFGGTISANGQQINWTGNAAQYGSAINLRGQGGSTATFEWGHPNTSGFGSTIGYEVGTGASFIAFSAGPGTTNNTYKTFGVKGSLIKSDNAGGFVMASIANASADNQTPTTIFSIDTSGNAKASSHLGNSASGGVGYTTGAGGTVTQITSRTTGVTLNKVSGAITLFSQVNSAVSEATSQTFTVTNSAVAATDTIIVNQKSGTDKYLIFVTNVAAGSFAITCFTTGGTTNEAPVFTFNVLKGVTS